MAPWSERARTIASAIAVLVVVQAIAFVVYRWRGAERGGEAMNGFELERLSRAPAPVLALQTSDGTRIDWTALRGKPVLVHFWASWCTPCRKELPVLLEVARERADRLHVLAVSLDSDWDPVRLFFDGAVPQQVSRALDAGAVARYGATTLPDSFVVSASGALIARMRGPRDWRSKEAQDALRSWELER